MVNHSIRKLGDWQQPIKFKESILQQTKKTQALTWDFFYINNTVYQIFTLLSGAIYIPSFD
jgi:hypothetical protein